MAKKVLIGSVAAAGVVILGVGGVALATGDRDSGVETVDLSASAPQASGATDAPSPEASQGGEVGGSAVNAGGEPTDAVPAGVTSEQAREIAVQAKAGTVDWLELTNDFGTTVWNVEVVDSERVEWDVYIDADSGEVLDVERD